MDEVPLKSPDGVVRAWMCGVCRCVKAHADSVDGTDEEMSLAEAKDCCLCRSCRTPLGRMEYECQPCRSRQRAELESHWQSRRPDQEKFNARADAAMAMALDGDAAELLLVRMGDISEECYCAGWMSGLENALWGLANRGGGPYGMGSIDAGSAAELLRLAEKAGGWWIWECDGAVSGNLFVPLVEWKSQYDAEQKANH